MNLLTNSTTAGLWQDVVKNAENRCSIALKKELEAYLVTLLARYMTHSELTHQIFATAFMHAMQKQHKERDVALQEVGDQCLIYAGLYPNNAERRLVKLSYFVDIGRSAYAHISGAANDLYGSLAVQFVVLMDVLQAIREYPQMLPQEAYDIWHEVGSARAYRIWHEYLEQGVVPFNLYRK